MTEELGAEALAQPTREMTVSDEVMIQMIDVHKWYGQFHVLKDINLTVNRGERIVVCGPSGSGKSTLIRCLNRLEEHQKGQIVIEGTELTNDLKHIEQIRREVGMVFQHFNLFQHKTALENVTLPQVVVLKRSRADAMDKANQLLERVGIGSMGNSYPRQLSGGQQQRVAIARSLGMDPTVMLFDEATSALDPETVGGVLELMEELADSGMTMVVVTHEMGFARKAANRMLFMDDGALIEEGDPESFFDNPRAERLRTFLSQIV